MKKLYAQILVFAIIVCTPSIASYARNKIKHISNVDGLTNNSVNCILEDEEHTIWVGTWDGLNAYNGREITTFRYSKRDLNSISNNVIRQIIENKESIWIATDYGVNRLDKRTKKATRYYLRNDNKAPTQEKSFILGKSEQGNIICFMKEVGFFVYNPTQNKFIPIPTDFANLIKDYAVNDSDYVLFLFKDGRVKYMNYDLLVNGGKTSDLRSINIQTSIEKIFLSEGKFILIYENELILLNPDFTTRQHIKLKMHKPISHAILTKDEMFISFIEGGCIQYDLRNNTYTYLNKLSKQLSVFTLFYGSQDILWIGTDGQGLIQFYDYNEIFETKYTNHPVRCFCEDANHNMLIGTKGSGIKLLNPRTKELVDYLNVNNGLISNSVYALRRNKANDIFIGTEGAGINILYSSSGSLEKLAIPNKYPLFSAVYNIHFTNNDSILWVGTSGNGLIRMNIEREKGKYRVSEFIQYNSSDGNNPLNNDVVYAITSNQSDSLLWFGTRGDGLKCINVDKNSMKSLEDLDSINLLTNNDVLCLSPDEKGVWIGTSYGLNRLINTTKSYYLKQYTDEKLRNKTIHGILKDHKGMVWISTNQGISSLNVSNNTVRSYTLNDGLQNDEFSDGAFYQDQHNVLYFGGVSGFSYFNPTNIHLRTFNPPLVLTDLKINNTAQDIHKRIIKGLLKLSYDERFISLKFLAKDYINSENCEYAYRLKNHSADWIEMGNQPIISITRLPPGEYQLEVRSTNGDKVWSNNTFRLAIKMGYPWWLSVPALFIYAILSILLFFLIKSIIQNRIRLSRQILIAKIEKEHEQKIHESQLNFFTNVAHEFFTPLTLIYTPAQHLLAQDNLGEKAMEYLRIITSNAERMQKLISELMEFRNTKSGVANLHPENVDIKALIKFVSSNYASILQENGINFKVEAHDISEIFSDRNALEKIMFNLLSNAFKYTPKNGYIKVEVSQNTVNKTLYLLVKNSGKGLTKLQMAEIFDKYKIFDRSQLSLSTSTGIGLNLTKSLVELLGGQITVSSKIGKSVEFSIVIPPLSAGQLSTEINENSLLSKDKKSNNLPPSKDIAILIVEDEKKIRDLMKDILSEYIIYEAKDGAEALNVIEYNHPDIIISDIVMPNMDGLSLIDKLKSDPKTSYIPVIGISAKATVEDQINAFNHGADAYIVKPFHPRQVISTLENLLSRQKLLKEYFNSSISSIKIKDGVALYPEDERLIENVINFIKDNIDDELLSPSSIADFLGVSRATLYRKFKEILHKTPSEFIRGIRLDHATMLLRTSKLTVSEIMFNSGFSNKSYFYREFLKQYGVSPTDYRNQ